VYAVSWSIQEAHSQTSLGEEVQMLVELGELTRLATPLFFEVWNVMNHSDDVQLARSTDVSPVEYEVCSVLRTIAE